MWKAEQNSGTCLNCAPHWPFIRSPQKKTAQREFRAHAFITVTSRDHALNNAVKSSKKHSSSAQSSPVQITSLSFKQINRSCYSHQHWCRKQQKQCNNDPVRRRFNPQITHIYHSFTVVTLTVTMVRWQKSRILILSIINILNMLKE